jgi:hypothetical protein
MVVADRGTWPVLRSAPHQQCDPTGAQRDGQELLFNQMVLAKVRAHP